MQSFAGLLAPGGVGIYIQKQCASITGVYGPVCGSDHYEGLEFLGDAVLDYIVIPISAN